MARICFIDGRIYVQCSGKNFADQLDSCRYLHMVYDPQKKMWSSSPGKLAEVEAEFKPYGIEMSEYDRLQIRDYFKSLSTFERTTKRSEYVRFNDSIMKLPAKYQWQKDDVQRAINQTSMLFKWATGTGKSYALSSIFEELRATGKVKKAIILTSSIGIMNLASELQKFMRSFDRSRCLVIGSVTQLEDRAVFSNDKYDVVICGYDCFKTINDYYDKIVHKRDGKKRVKYKKSSLPLAEWYAPYEGIVFMDECHLIGNQGSHRADTIMMNLQFWKYRYLFSATPADKEVKFYNLIKVLDNALTKGMSYSDWLSTYCEIGTKFSKYAPDMSTWDYGKWDRDMARIDSGYILNRDKSLLNLPSAIDVPLIELDMSKEQRAVYESFSNLSLALMRERSQETGNSLAKTLVNTFQTLQMAVDNPEAIAGSPTMFKLRDIARNDASVAQQLAALEKALDKFSYSKHFSKLQALDSIIDYECKELGNKVLVFYYHPKTLEVLRRIYPKAFVLSADMPEAERFELINKFRTSSEKMLIASILIANTSFTLTECKAEVFYERCWSGIVYEQARGRIHRIGQEDEVRYYNMCYNNSIDSVQLVALQTKGAFIASIGSRSSLSTSDWKTLFNGSYDEINALIAD